MHGRHRLRVPSVSGDGPTMNDFRQNRFPYSPAVAPVGGPVLFNEQFLAGSGGSWISPGSVAHAGTQLPPAAYARWDPSAQMPPGGSSFVDINRGAFAVQSAVPPAMEFCWTGFTTRTAPPWSVESEAFSLQLFSRVGVVNEFQPFLSTETGFAGVIVSLANLAGIVDGPFISLGMRSSSDGPLVTFSKWSDHLTFVEMASAPVTAPSVFVRAIIEVDPEDGIEVAYPEWSADGFGWKLFGNPLLLEGENERLTIGFGSTGYTDDASVFETMAAYVGPTQLLGPYPQGDETIFGLRMATQGGRNWP